jgi:hypothetical protein
MTVLMASTPVKVLLAIAYTILELLGELVGAIVLILIGIAIVGRCRALRSRRRSRRSNDGIGIE